MESVFVTGTGTDVGKTHVCEHLLKSGGVYYKPVASGGAERLSGVYSYIFEPAVSPHLAAAMAGVEIKKEKIASDFARIEADYIIVEGAGGIFTPLGDNLTQPDIIKMLGLPVIIVADAGLGTINATVLTLEYARTHDITVKGVILNRYDAANPMHTDNKKQIEKYAEVLECLP